MTDLLRTSELDSSTQQAYQPHVLGVRLVRRFPAKLAAGAHFSLPEITGGSEGEAVRRDADGVGRAGGGDFAHFHRAEAASGADAGEGIPIAHERAAEW